MMRLKNFLLYRGEDFVQKSICARTNERGCTSHGDSKLNTFLPNAIRRNINFFLKGKTKN